jgi:ferric-dicitrate binding protein FerR (iron transport regulator)
MIRKQEEEAPEVPTAALVQLIHTQRSSMSTRQRVEGIQRLLSRAAESRRGARFSARSLAALALAVGVLVVGVVFAVSGVRGRLATTSALSYAVDDGHVAKGGGIEADSSNPPRLRFSDGTEVLLGPKTKAALRSVDSRGARLSLVEGSARVDVVHKPAASWLIDAGPFVVVVTGTAFTVQWNPIDEEFDLKMERGTVEVSGPLSDGAISLRSGQRLVVRVRQRETLIRDADDVPAKLDPEDKPSEPPASPVNVGAAEVEVSAATAPAHSGQAAGDRVIDRATDHWSVELARGEFEAIVQQAERRGLDASLAEASSVDLAALADAARYGRHDDVARRALLAQRRRYPASGAARDASFLLGRLEETRHDVAGAVEWFDRYLTESPLGTYASEALGRKMVLIQQLYGDGRARPVAKEYLGRFSQGTYAARARALAREQ